VELPRAGSIWDEQEESKQRPKRREGNLPVGVIVREEYVCDYCTRPIRDSDMQMGKLSVRKRGARGLGREVLLTLHAACSDKLTANASGLSHSRRARTGIAAEPEPEPTAPVKAKRSPAAAAQRRRKAKSSLAPSTS
jgi:hypothetical protein